MKFPRSFKTADELIKFMDDIQIRKCSKCKDTLSYCIKCGFQDYNERLECLRCEEVLE
jgi:hypothetical protein